MKRNESESVQTWFFRLAQHVTKSGKYVPMLGKPRKKITHPVQTSTQRVTAEREKKRTVSIIYGPFIEASLHVHKFNENHPGILPPAAPRLVGAVQVYASACSGTSGGTHLSPDGSRRAPAT